MTDEDMRCSTPLSDVAPARLAMTSRRHEDRCVSKARAIPPGTTAKACFCSQRHDYGFDLGIKIKDLATFFMPPTGLKPPNGTAGSIEL